MRKSLLLALLLTCLVTFSNAQTPQYTVVTPNTNGNFFPFGAQATCGSSMVQLLYKPSDWTSIPPVGFITKLWFRWYSSCPTIGNTFTNLNVKMGPTNLNSLSTGAWNTGLTNVVTIPSLTVTSGPLQWFSIDLSANPYYYDPTQNLIIEISHNGGTSCGSLFISWINSPTGANQRMYGAYGSGSGNADNERYDMGIDLFAGYPCTGTPTSTVQAPTEVCPNRQFNVRPATFYSNATYQWEYSTNGTSWQPHPATVGLYGDINDAITQDRWYRCTITCIATGLSYTTPAWKVGISPFYYCYCVTAATASAGLDIGNVTVTNMNSNKVVLNNGIATPYLSNTQASKSYTSFQYTVPAAVMYRDTTYNFSVTQTSSSATAKSGNVAIFVDFNRDGLFDGTEKVMAKTITTASTIPFTETATFKVPTAAQIGLTGMRVILSDGNPDSCGNVTGEGEIEDYLVELRNEPCRGPGNAGTIIPTEKSLCAGYDYVVLDTTYDKTKSELDRHWQVSGDNINWSTVAGSNNVDYLSRVFTGQPLYYRVRMVCQRTSDTTYSPIQKIDAKAGYKCYCYSQAEGASKDTSDVGGMSVGTFTSNSGGAHLQNVLAYRKRQDFTDDPAVHFFTDSTYQLIVYHTMRSVEHGDAKVTMFMDFNNNKEYDIPYERVYTGYTSIGNFTLVKDFQIPDMVITDVPTGMRVILNNDISPSNASDLGCGPYTSGETQDLIAVFHRKFPAGVAGVNTPFKSLVLSPNPTNGKFNLLFNTDKDVKEITVTIKNVTGQVIQEHKFAHNAGQFEKELDMSTHARGIYFVELSDATGEKLTKKLVVE